jgi:hypothetical protein
MAAQGIDDLGPLPHQKIAGPEHHRSGLGRLALGCHKAHGGKLSRLADRLGLRGIGLLALDERLHVSGWDQSHMVAELADFARPVVRTAAGLHGYCAGRLGREERKNLAAPQLLAEDNSS